MLMVECLVLPCKWDEQLVYVKESVFGIEDGAGLLTDNAWFQELVDQDPKVVKGNPS